MKIASPAIERTSNVSRERRQLEGRLNSEKLGLFMKSLISNYNNPNHATLREWVSNAHDSHVKAGQTKPVKITLPTRFSPTLTVEDFGVGMSFEEVENVYAVLLTSTKDQDNEGIGGYGIGGKSALAIADQYTMVAVKDGLKNIFIFERSETGGFKVTPALENEPTDQPNGVKVSVAVSNTFDFTADEINYVLEGWKQNEIEVVGGDVQFKSFYDNAIDFDYGLVKKEMFNGEEAGNSFYRGNRDGLRVFVGPVAYRVPRGFFNAWREQHREHRDFISNFSEFLALKVPIGAVTFPSSREVIEDTEANIQAIVEAAVKLEDAIQAYVDELVKNFSNIKEAYNFACSSFATQSGAEVNYEGRNLNRIKYAGFKAFYMYASNPSGANLRLEEVPKNEINHLDGKFINSVIRVKSEHADYASDTYRKYVRAVALDVYKDYQKTFSSRYRAYGYNRAVMLLTTEHDDLHEVTAKVYDYDELRKNTPKELRQSNNRRLSDKEREERAAEVRVLFLNSSEDHDYYYGTRERFSKHPAYENGDPIIMLGKDLSAEIIPTIEAILGVKDRLVLVDNKTAGKQIRMVFPNALSLEEYLNKASKKERKTHIANFNRISAVSKKLALNSRDAARLENILKQEDVSDEARSLFELNDCLASAGVSRIFGYWNNAELAALKSHLKIDKASGYYSVNRKAPFSLLNFSADEQDIKDYLNWMATRDLSKKV